jgi:hypothetical protein
MTDAAREFYICVVALALTTIAGWRLVEWRRGVKRQKTLLKGAAK